MMDGPSAQAAPDLAPDRARDWAEICQSEWRAMAGDRELAEAAAAFAALWSEAIAATAAMAALFADGAAGRAWSRPAAGATPALAPSDAGDADGERRIAQLARRVAELERRLAGLEPAPGATGGR